MNLENLRLFVEVARRGNFATVARDHDVDPSSVSRSMSQLEEEIGIRLFQRSTRHVALTESGEIYFTRITALLDALEQARDDAKASSNEADGTLRLTTSVAFGNTCLVPLLGLFRQQYPKVKLELLLTDTVLDLVPERIDLAIRLGKPTTTDLVTTKLFDTRYHICASPAYLQTHTPPALPQDLQQHSCLLFALPEFRSRWLFRDQHNVIEEVPVHGDISILSALALRECALAGLGPVLLANWLIGKDIAAGTLIDLFPQHHVTATDFATAIWLVYPSRTHLPSKVRVMIDFLKQQLVC